MTYSLFLYTFVLIDCTLDNKPFLNLNLNLNLDFDEFMAKGGVSQVGPFSNQTEYDVIHQFYLASSFFPTTFYLIRTTI